MREAVIVSACRTPIGSYGGTLKNVPARDLGALCLREALRRAGAPPECVEEVVMGNVLQAGLGQNPARQMMMDAGIPKETPAFTLNMVCGSGLRAVSAAAQIIRAGDADVVAAGGAESMSMAPYAVPKMRWGARMGDAGMIDVMVNDGLTDAFYHYHMGVTAENVAAKWGVTREELDEFALRSQQKAEAAVRTGRFRDEIVPVEVPQRKGDPVLFDTDEYPRFGASLEKMAKLPPAFQEGGVVTAGNASGLNDCGAAVLVMERGKADALGIRPLFRIVSYASAGVDPQIMGVGPIPATKKALEKAGLTVADLDLIEANEAFAAQSVVVARELGFDPEKLNVNGGAIALGHPIGASGCRILVTLLYEMMKRPETKTGLATLCIGGGMGTSLIVEKC